MMTVKRGNSVIYSILKREALSGAAAVDCEEEPDAIYIFAEATPAGVLIDKHLGVFAQLPADEWMWYNSQITFGNERTGYMMAFTGEIFLFKDEVIPVVGTAELRSRVITINLSNPETDYIYTNISITSEEFYELAATDHSWITFSADNTTFVSTLEIESINPSSNANIYVKILLPEGMPVFNYRNIGMKTLYAKMYNE